MSPILNDVQADLILPDLKASTSRQVLQVLAAEIALHTDIDLETLYEELIRKEHASPSGMGGGVAIPHLQIAGLREHYLMLARLQNRIDFGAADHQDVDLVCVLVSPAEDGPIHLRRLSRISRIFRNEKLCADLRAAKDQHAMRALLSAPEHWEMAA